MSTIAARRRAAQNATESTDLNGPTIVTPTEELADVIEQVGSKTLNYKAKVTKANENPNNGNESQNIPDSSENDNQDEPAEKIRINPLAVMFQKIRENTEQGEPVIALITRRQDYLDDNFNSECSSEQTFAPLQITGNDFMRFVPKIQKANGNSGGRFSIIIANQNGEFLTYTTRKNFVDSTRNIGCSITVPDPAEDIIIENEHGNNNGSEFNMLQIIQEMRESDRQFQQRMFENLNRPKEKTILESALEQKMIQEIANPSNNNNGNGMDAMERMISGIVAAPIFAQKMTEKMFPPAPVEREPTTLDTIKEVMELGPVQNIVNGLVNVSSEYATQKMREQNKTAPPQNNPAQPPVTDPNIIETYDEPETDEMQILFETIVTELETDNPLDGSNETIQFLRTEYENHTNVITTTCKALAFEDTVKMLVSMSNKMKPQSPFVEFVDFAAMEIATNPNEIVWNERGQKMIERLKEFYEYVKTLD